MRPVSVDDHREAARRKLPRFLFEYIDGGSYAEATMAANAVDLGRVALRQRVLRDVSNIDLSATLFRQQLAMPVILGPVGLAGMYARRGEVQALRAARARNIPFTLSTVGVCSLREVSRKTKTPFWFQLYMLRDRGFMADLLDQAREAECPVLVFTVDMPAPGARYRDYRSGLAGGSGLHVELRRVLQAATHPSWALSVGVFGRPHTLGNVAPVLKGSTGLEDFITWMAANFDASVTWKDLDWVRARWPGPIVLKGVLDADDAKVACETGVDGIVVSNHGGRQLDGVRSSFSAMGPIMDAVDGRLPVLADSGIRSGLDVLRFLAAGASGVLLGRAWAYALAGGGKAGVESMLDTVRKELMLGMTLTGCRTLADIGPHILDTSAR